MRIKPVSFLIVSFLLASAVFFTAAPLARAGTIWNWTHEASGSGSANVFDGGPTDFDTGATTEPTDHFMSFLALDFTDTSGSFSANAKAGGRSQVVEASDTTFRISVDLVVGYFPSGFPGGDNPGGQAEGELTSVIEFTMPAEKLTWYYQLLIDETGAFHGDTNVFVQNVTQSRTLLQLSSEVFSVQTTLFADKGDTIRITSEMSGAGSMGPGSFREYQSTAEMFFIVPEPQTFLLLALGAIFTLQKPRRNLTRRD